MKEILRSQWNYMLCEKDERLVFSVICGRAALFEVNIYLNNDELLSYKKDGEAYLQQLAEAIRNNPKAYSDGNIDLKNQPLFRL